MMLNFKKISCVIFAIFFVIVLPLFAQDNDLKCNEELFNLDQNLDEEQIVVRDQLSKYGQINPQLLKMFNQSSLNSKEVSDGMSELKRLTKESQKYQLGQDPDYVNDPQLQNWLAGDKNKSCALICENQRQAIADNYQQRCDSYLDNLDKSLSADLFLNVLKDIKDKELSKCAPPPWKFYTNNQDDFKPEGCDCSKILSPKKNEEYCSECIAKLPKISKQDRDDYLKNLFSQDLKKSATNSLKAQIKDYFELIDFYRANKKDGNIPENCAPENLFKTDLSLIKPLGQLSCGPNGFKKFADQLYQEYFGNNNVSKDLKTPEEKLNIVAMKCGTEGEGCSKSDAPISSKIDLETFLEEVYSEIEKEEGSIEEKIAKFNFEKYLKSIENQDYYKNLPNAVKEDINIYVVNKLINREDVGLPWDKKHFESRCSWMQKELVNTCIYHDESIKFEDLFKHNIGVGAYLTTNNPGFDFLKPLSDLSQNYDEQSSIYSSLYEGDHVGRMYCDNYKKYKKERECFEDLNAKTNGTIKNLIRQYLNSWVKDQNGGKLELTKDSINSFFSKILGLDEEQTNKILDKYNIDLDNQKQLNTSTMQSLLVHAIYNELRSDRATNVSLQSQQAILNERKNLKEILVDASKSKDKLFDLVSNVFDVNEGSKDYNEQQNYELAKKEKPHNKVNNISGARAKVENAPVKVRGSQTLPKPTNTIEGQDFSNYGQNISSSGVTSDQSFRKFEDVIRNLDFDDLKKTQDQTEQKLATNNKEIERIANNLATNAGKFSSEDRESLSRLNSENDKLRKELESLKKEIAQRSAQPEKKIIAANQGESVFRGSPSASRSPAVTNNTNINQASNSGSSASANGSNGISKTDNSVSLTADPGRALMAKFRNDSEQSTDSPDLIKTKSGEATLIKAEDFVGKILENEINLTENEVSFIKYNGVQDYLTDNQFPLENSYKLFVSKDNQKQALGLWDGREQSLVIVDGMQSYFQIKPVTIPLEVEKPAQRVPASIEEKPASVETNSNERIYLLDEFNSELNRKMPDQ